MVYRDAPGGEPTDDPLFVEPGKGVRGIWVGRATPEDVLRVFGDDADVSRYENGDVFLISHLWGRDREQPASRPDMQSCPARFTFAFGLVSSIEIGPYQSDLYTTGGLHYHSTRAEVVRTLGEPDDVLRSESFEELRYQSLGISLMLSRDDGTVSRYTIFRARR